MGRTTTTKYALEIDGSTSRCWYVGKPTVANLNRYVAEYMKSLEPGGSNVNISKALGFVPYPNWARIVVNDGSRSVVVEWKAPMFMLVGGA